MRVLSSGTTLWLVLFHTQNHKNQFLVSNQAELQHKYEFLLRAQWSFAEQKLRILSLMSNVLKDEETAYVFLGF